jgi:hypothetical protein
MNDKFRRQALWDRSTLFQYHEAELRLSVSHLGHTLGSPRVWGAPLDRDQALQVHVVRHDAAPAAPPAAAPVALQHPHHLRAATLAPHPVAVIRTAPSKGALSKHCG